MFTKKDIATYYNHTMLDYKVGWGLNKSKGVHFGLWYDDTKDLHEAIVNTNKLIARYIPLKSDLRLLDAGCGVGGTALYLADNFDCYVEGITLSNSQCDLGRKFVLKANLQEKVNISIQDYSNTTFTDSSFDMIYAIESICHAKDKLKVYEEFHRLLKPGGRLVFVEYIKTPKGSMPDSRKTLNWLLHRWAISDIDTKKDTIDKLAIAGFRDIENEDLTKNVLRSVKIMRIRAMLGIITIPLYTVLHPTKYHFSRRHPESGWALHKCFRKKLMEYHCFTCIK